MNKKIFYMFQLIMWSIISGMWLISSSTELKSGNVFESGLYFVGVIIQMTLIIVLFKNALNYLTVKEML